MVCVFHQQSVLFLMLDLCKDQTLFCALQDGSALQKPNALLGFVWMRKPSVPARRFSHYMEHGIPWQTCGINSHRKKAGMTGSYPVHQPVFITESISQKLLHCTGTEKADQRKCSSMLLSEHFTRNQELCIPDETLAISWSQLISTPNHLKLRSTSNRCSLQGQQGGTSFN